MTNIIQNYADKAMCSKAAYANFTGIGEIERENGKVDTNGINFGLAKKSLEKAGFSEAEAISFLNRFDISYSYKSPSESGLAFTIFEDVKSHELNLSVKGANIELGEGETWKKAFYDNFNMIFRYLPFVFYNSISIPSKASAVFSGKNFVTFA